MSAVGFIEQILVDLAIRQPSFRHQEAGMALLAKGFHPSSASKGLSALVDRGFLNRTGTRRYPVYSRVLGTEPGDFDEESEESVEVQIPAADLMLQRIAEQRIARIFNALVDDLDPEMAIRVYKVLREVLLERS